jgi:hypothetical protein
VELAQPKRGGGSASSLLEELSCLIAMPVRRHRVLRELSTLRRRGCRRAMELQFLEVWRSGDIFYRRRARREVRPALAAKFPFSCI